MIAFLDGTVAFLNPPYLIVNVHGVGYKVLVSSQVLTAITGLNTPIKLFTYTHVREDLLELYGFATYHDLKLFESLISVSGIGPKTAVGVFALGTYQEISKAIVEGDVNFFTSVPRLGKKNAQKLIIELKTKFSNAILDDSIPELSSEGGSKELIEALRGFGFTNKEALEAIKNSNGHGKTIEERIKQALKYLAK